MQPRHFVALLCDIFGIGRCLARMGCTPGRPLSDAELKARKEEKIRSKWIDQSIVKEKKTDRESIKLLFLGAGESGKSTLLKQMKIINAQGFDQDERKEFLPLIHSNVIQSIRTLVRQCRDFHDNPPETFTVRDFTFTAEGETCAQRIEPLKLDDPLSDVIVQDIMTVWKDPATFKTFSLRSKYQLSDSAQYFLDRAHEVTRPNYVPNEQDILRARIRTTGIVEHKFTIDKNDFRMYDVGGQRSARKKWIHCFEKVTSVIFVAAISGYDQVLYEDNKTNSLHEALHLFGEICGSRWFVRTSIILFLNKKDIFREKITKVPLTYCFPHYEGKNEYREAVAFIKSEFEQQAHQVDPEKRIYTHITCATDTTNIKRVFDIVKVIIVRTHLIEVGLMDATQDFEQVSRPHDDNDEKNNDSEDDPDSPQQ